jgi:hypothetical protein
MCAEGELLGSSVETKSAASSVRRCGGVGLALALVLVLAGSAGAGTASATAIA